MQAFQNKRIVAEAMHALAQGDMRPFYEAWADDVVWRQMAVSGPWSQTFRGKAAASERLFIPCAPSTRTAILTWPPTSWPTATMSSWSAAARSR